MIPVTSLAGKHVAVFGLGGSGRATVAALVAGGATVSAWDDKAETVRDANHAGIATADLRRADWRDFTCLVLAAGVPLTHPEPHWTVRKAETAGIEIIGDIELFCRERRRHSPQAPFVAITGTKGKSTTTTLVGRMLEASGRRVLVGGNIGVPLSAQVDESTADTLHIVEASSFQLETTNTFHPWIAALLNLSPDHLDRHPSDAAYADAKARVFANQGPDDWTVVNSNSPGALALASRSRARLVRYSADGVLDEGVYVEGGVIWRRTSEGAVPLVPLSAVRLHGRHMLGNVVAASAISHLAGASETGMTAGVTGFTGLEHVMEPVASSGGVRFVNDSKATNVDAAARSIESFDGVVAIVGGRFKGGRFEDLRAPLAAHGRAVVAIGETRPLVVAALGGVVPVEEAASMAEAVARAATLAAPDGVVLLAPACSSFDMFESYDARGRAFKEEVARLTRERVGEGEQ